jgi:hypothetical protein
MRSLRSLSRRGRAALAVVAVAVVALCLLADLRLRPTGAKRDVLWGAGLVAYAFLLDGAIGRARDHRDVSGRANASAPGHRTVPFRTSSAFFPDFFRDRARSSSHDDELIEDPRAGLF